MSYNTDLQTNNDELQTILNAINALPELLPEQAKTVIPSLSEQTITPDSGKTLSSVQVSAITKELLANLDSDFIADNIAKDIDLFGLVGTLEASSGGGNITCGEFTLAETANRYIFMTDIDKPRFMLVYKADSVTDGDYSWLILASLETDNKYYQVGLRNNTSYSTQKFINTSITTSAALGWYNRAITIYAFGYNMIAGTYKYLLVF